MGIAACKAEQHRASAVSPDELLARSIAGYRNATSYHDRGTIRTTVGEHVSARAFETHFDDAGRLQFDLARVGAPAPYRIVIGKNDAHRTRSDGTSEQLASPMHALSAATGVSRGTALIVPPLLLDLEAKQSLLASVTAMQQRGSITIRGDRCEEIAGLDRSGNAMTIWLREDGVLCRVERRIEHRVAEPFSVRIDYESVTLTP